MPEISQIPSSAANTTCKLECVDPDICTDCRTHRDLLCQVAALRRRVNARNDLLISAFPLEIVCTIFEAYVNLHVVPPAEQYENEYNEIDENPRFFDAVHRSVPLKLGSICHTWRRLAWSWPRLWTTLYLYLPCPGHKLGPELVNQWLSRAQHALVNIRIDDDYDIFGRNLVVRDSVRAASIQVIEELNRFSRIWQALDLAGVSFHLLERFDDSQMGDVSSLERFSFGGAMDIRIGEVTQHVFRGSKRKHPITHLSILSEISFHQLHIDWSHITNLHLCDMSRRLCFSAIIHAVDAPLTHLTIGSIYDYAARDRSWVPNDGVILPHLTHLSLTDRISSALTTPNILDRLDTPRLQCFEYDGHFDVMVPDGEEMGNFPADKFIAFLGRTDCHLISASFTDPIVSDDDFLRVLQHIPSLRSLQVAFRFSISTEKVDGLLRRLSQNSLRSDKLPFLPLLASLDVSAHALKDWAPIVGIYDDHFVDVDDISVLFDSPPQVPMRKELKILFKIVERASGLQVGHCIAQGVVVRLVQLWKLHGVSCAVELAPWANHDPDMPFLYKSWLHGQAGFAACPPEFDKDLSTISKFHEWLIHDTKLRMKRDEEYRLKNRSQPLWIEQPPGDHYY